MARTLQIALVTIGAIPLFIGLMNFYFGAGAPWLPTSEITPNADSQLRFYAIWFTLPFFASIWMARHLDRALPIAAIIFGAMFAGGLARLYSALTVGWPDPQMIGAMCIEIAVILFVPWIRAVSSRLSKQT